MDDGETERMPNGQMKVGSKSQWAFSGSVKTDAGHAPRHAQIEEDFGHLAEDEKPSFIEPLVTRVARKMADRGIILPKQLKKAAVGEVNADVGEE